MNLRDADSQSPPASMPQFSMGFSLSFLTCAKNFTATIATGRKLGIVAVSAVDLIRLSSELLVHQRQMALEAQETGLVPVLVFVGKILG